MKKIFQLILLLFCTSLANGQSLNSVDYHQHRSSLHNSILKFQKEKKGRVAFLGGSITYNGGWRDSICNYLQEKFPETEFDFVAAGIPSMGSTPAAFRFERDVLKNGPVDLLFEEAAVNDASNGRTADEMVRGMEGIVRHARSSNPKCDIVIMHFVDPDKMETYRSGKIPLVIQQHERVAEHYHISTINLAKEVTDRIDAGEFTWEDDFKNLHPSPFGQGIYAHSMLRFLENEFNADYSSKEIGAHVSLKPLDDSSYGKGKLVLPNPPKAIKGWTMVENWQPEQGNTRANYTKVPMLVGEYPGKIIKFSFKGTAVGIAVAAGHDAGIIEYSVDDQPWQKQDLYTRWSKSLHLPWYFTLESGLKDRKHTLQIRMTDERNALSTGNRCVLRYFYYNGE